MDPSQTTLAYLAGVIDSDGYITISRSISKGRRYYGAQVGIAGTRREPHDLAASIWGGAVHCYTPKNVAHRPQFQWARTGRMAAEIVSAIFPFLLVKREQAELALETERLNDDARADDPFPWFGPDFDHLDELERLFIEAKALNCRKPRGKQLRLHFPEKQRQRRSAEGDGKVVFVAFDGRVFDRECDAPPNAMRMIRVGKKAAGRLLDGVEHSEFPEVRR